jgi:hypothetical protein
MIFCTFLPLLYATVKITDMYYKQIIKNNYIKRDKFKFSEYFVLELQFSNIKTYIEENEIDSTVEQLTTNLMYSIGSVFALSYYNKMYFVVQRDNNMNCKINECNIFKTLSQSLSDKLEEESEDNCIKFDLFYHEIKEGKLDKFFKSIIHHNKFKFMKHLSKKSGVKFSSQTPFGDKNMDTFYKKYNKVSGTDYLSNPLYGCCYKWIDDEHAISFKTEFTDIDNLTEFITKSEVHPSELFTTDGFYDIHYVDNEMYKIYEDTDEDTEQEESNCSTSSSEDESESNVDYQTYKIIGTRDDKKYSVEIEASNIENALVKAYYMMVGTNIINPETLHYHVNDDVYIIHDNSFSENTDKQFILIEQINKGNSSIGGDETNNSKDYDDMPPLIPCDNLEEPEPEPEPEPEQEQNDSGESAVDVSEDDLN